MCGRLACGLSREEICNSCCYKDSGTNNYAVPQWKDCHNGGKTYKPSYNICPNDVASVLLSGSHFKLNSRLVCPMVFGVIPQWQSKTRPKLKTINCRIETIESAKLYGPLLQKGQRCVVICNGFYEWQKQNQSKKPYFCYNEQTDGVVIDDPNTWNLKFTVENGYSGFKPIKLAALFERSSNSLEEATLSFTIITKDASSETSWLHSRVPAILKTDEQLDAWLNHEEVNPKLALSYISETTTFVCHPVSNTVNKTNEKDISCIKQEKKKDEKQKSSADFLKEWLERGKKREGSPVADTINEKVRKVDV